MYGSISHCEAHHAVIGTVPQGPSTSERFPKGFRRTLRDLPQGTINLQSPISNRSLAFTLCYWLSGHVYQNTMPVKEEERFMYPARIRVCLQIIFGRRTAATGCACFLLLSTLRCIAISYDMAASRALISAFSLVLWPTNLFCKHTLVHLGRDSITL